MNSYRGGASITRMGRFIVVSGGNRFPAPLSSIEVLNTRKPEKWRTLSKLTLPNPTYDHCSVAINKTSMFVTGGFGQESQAIMLDLLNKNYKAEPSMRQPRRKVRLLKSNLLCNLFIQNEYINILSNHKTAVCNWLKDYLEIEISVAPAFMLSGVGKYALVTLLFYQIEPLKNGPFLVLLSSLSRD